MPTGTPQPQSGGFPRERPFTPELRTRAHVHCYSAHTDFGSFSMLHGRGCGGLQVLPPGTSKWQHIRPLPGHAVCNVGDTLAVYSGNIFKSNVSYRSRKVNHALLTDTRLTADPPRRSSSSASEPGRALVPRLLYPSRFQQPAHPSLGQVGDYPRARRKGRGDAGPPEGRDGRLVVPAKDQVAARKEPHRTRDVGSIAWHGA